MQAALEDPKSDPFRGDLWRLNLLSWSEWKPLALHFMHVFQQAQQKGEARRCGVVRNRFEMFHRRAIGITLAGLNAKTRSAMFARAIEQSEGLGSAGRTTNCMSSNGGALRLKQLQRERAESQLERGFEDQTLRETFLRWLESVECGPIRLTNDILEGEVDHVLPQEVVAENDYWNEEFPDATERMMLINLLGNLTLVDRRSAQVVKVEDFDAKIELYRNLAPQFMLTQDVLKSEGWRKHDIMARTRRLKNIAKLELRWNEAAGPAKVHVHGNGANQIIVADVPRH